MTSAEQRRCMCLLHAAKDGDEMAYEYLTAAIVEHYGYMIRGYYSCDPAYDMDDLMSEFRRAVWQAIDRVDERGNPIFHLAWRGAYAVKSMLSAMKQHRYGTEAWARDYGAERSIGTLPQDWDLVDTREENDPQYVVQVREERDETRRHAYYVVANARLTTKQERVLDWMLGHLDTEEGANQLLARDLGVSEQAASVMRKKVETALGVEPEPQAEFVCDGCGRVLGSKGALTQHKRGTSGHRPCEALAV